MDKNKRLFSKFDGFASKDKCESNLKLFSGIKQNSYNDLFIYITSFTLYCRVLFAVSSLPFLDSSKDFNDGEKVKAFTDRWSIGTTSTEDAVSEFKFLAKELGFCMVWAHYLGMHFLLGFPAMLESPV